MKLRIEHISTIYFLGIGGIGMSALARYFRAKGKIVHGYDRVPTELTAELQREGMFIHFEDDPAAIPWDIDLVIYTPAIPADLNEFAILKKSGVPMMKRSQAIGWITENRFTIAVAGSHGKTSISSMIAHIFMSAGMPVTTLIGGISRNYQSNYISSGKEDIMVVEADEFDRSFLELHPDIAVISAMDPDHLDIYGTGEEMVRSFNDFAGNIKPNGILFIRKGLTITTSPDIRRFEYAADEEADFKGFNLRIENSMQLFNMYSAKLNWPDISLKIPGRHNVENALAAIAVSSEAGIGLEKIMEAVRSFSGVRRRFDIRIQKDDVVYIDDYAHHPEELKAFITAVRELYPAKSITGLFQPHLYSRTRDFAAGFAESLDLLDEIWLLDIYPAREKPIPGVTASLILNRIRNQNKCLLTRHEVFRRLSDLKPEVFLTMGAGDIDQLVKPVGKILLSCKRS